MRSLVELPLANGETVLVEVQSDDDGVVRAARPGEVIATVGESLQASLDRLRPLAQALVEKFRGLEHAPESISVEFGIKVTAEAKVVIAHAGSEANFKVQLQWNRR